MKKSRSDPACAGCGNEVDLEPVDGALFCISCRTCPHGVFYTEGSAFGDDVADFTHHGMCNLCLRDWNTLWTMTGPVIRNLAFYALDGMTLGVDPDQLDVWNLNEADWLLGYGETPEEQALYDVFMKKKETERHVIPLSRLIHRRSPMP